MSILFDREGCPPPTSCHTCGRAYDAHSQVNLQHDSLYVRFEQLKRTVTVIAVRGQASSRPDIANLAQDALKLLNIIREQVLK